MGKFLKGLALGAAIGAGAALVKTTKKGKEISKKASVYADEIWQQIQDQYAKLPTAKRRKIDPYLKALVKEYAAKKKMASDVTADVLKIIKKKLV
ncbi:MAG: hypothetical protein HW383_183 [Candidatus Magasanikbacteria bacterium]|nr:hypothetical protein [Candidatus Magasanikbacteria bacterium]